MSSSSQDPTSTGKFVALFATQNRLNQETSSDREDFPFRHQQVFGSNELFFRFSSSNKLMFSDWNWRTPILDMLISRREQVRLQEELVMKEVFRDTQIGSIHEMGELMRASEL